MIFQFETLVLKKFPKIGKSCELSMNRKKFDNLGDGCYRKLIEGIEEDNWNLRISYMKQIKN